MAEETKKVHWHKRVTLNLGHVEIANHRLCWHDIERLLDEVATTIVPATGAVDLEKALILAATNMDAEQAALARDLAYKLRKDQWCPNCHEWFDYGKRCPNCITQVGVPTELVAGCMPKPPAESGFC